MKPSPLFDNPEPRRDSMSNPPELSRPGLHAIISQAGGDKAPSLPKRSLRILCIDDDEQILESMIDSLTYFGHRVRVASGGKYGIELFCTAILKSEPFDVVITDLGMPDVTGCEVARAIKAESPKTPVIMLTGQAAISSEGGAKITAVDIVVCKPPRIKELNDLLLRLAG
jgi:DNA-binding response OmpR family regulator